MSTPALQDTIVAVSSGWAPASIGILRLSGPDSFTLAEHLGVAPPDHVCSARWTAGDIRVKGAGTVPATAYWFHGPHSYTGQNVVEIHTVGCLPLLRALSDQLLEHGARRATPGEFTARAMVNGKMAPSQVEGVLALMRAEDDAGIRQGARLARGTQRQEWTELAERTTDLLTRIEAGIDFVEEEDIRFIAPAEVAATLDSLLARVDGLAHADRAEQHAGQPHVALAGLPNAGKSTLFNHLLGFARALVSPVLGTTRDVLSAEVQLGGHSVVLQDCAGLGRTIDDLELAMHLASERAAELADLVLWVHAVDVAWSNEEADLCVRVPSERRILVRTKADLVPADTATPPPIDFADCVDVSAVTGLGMDALRASLAAQLDRQAPVDGGASFHARENAFRACLSRARTLVADEVSGLESPELIAIELREALDQLTECVDEPLDEQILQRIFAEFCVGK